MFRMPLDILDSKLVVVIGFGRQGQALARWLATMNARTVVTDSKTVEQLGVDPVDFPRTALYLGEDLPDSVVANADLLCVSGGVPLTHPLVEVARENEVSITNDAQLFLDRCPAPVIGITGSAGKTTTTTLVAAMMRAAGYTTWVGGNIGRVLLDVMAGIQPDHQVVMELSSFQLELSFTSPVIAGVLNITPNHLDRHGTMREYMQAKSNIIGYQGTDGVAVLNRDDMGSRMLEPVAPGDVVWFSRREMVSDGAFLAGDRIVVTGVASTTGEPQIICDVADIPLRGDHNVANVLAACALAGSAGVPGEVMAETIRNFKSVPHRLEKVREHNGVTWVNDSIATAPERVLAALNSYDEPLVLLAGGTDKKLSWTDMVQVALRKARHIIAFGKDGEIVVEEVRKLTGDTRAVTRVQTLDEAVELASTIAQKGDVVLLSPGGTSYDAYRDFAQRGEHFRRLVNELP